VIEYAGDVNGPWTPKKSRVFRFLLDIIEAAIVNGFRQAKLRLSVLRAVDGDNVPEILVQNRELGCLIERTDCDLLSYRFNVHIGEFL
jgi:hypothetical protein